MCVCVCACVRACVCVCVCAHAANVSTGCAKIVFNFLCHFYEIIRETIKIFLLDATEIQQEKGKSRPAVHTMTCTYYDMYIL